MTEWAIPAFPDIELNLYGLWANRTASANHTTGHFKKFNVIYRHDPHLMKTICLSVTLSCIFTNDSGMSNYTKQN